ncbi:hypothetical protein [Paraburkholderia sp. LEh10]|uniref:hypothetical protein n=1 Tax=Paraburkholderia sp. LEh10 TaxID=2821353 RepID=UPI001FD73095|nr:hypothetical protein [Paraburkholderia sp. LEh10]
MNIAQREETIVFMRNDVTYQFHHLGIPTREVREGERYSPMYGMYTSDTACELVHIQYHRFDADSPLHVLMRTVPHPAFKVDNLAKAIDGKEVILGPYEPIDGFRIAVIVDGGMPIELIETALTDDHIWGRAATGKRAPLYAGSNPHRHADAAIITRGAAVRTSAKESAGSEGRASGARATRCGSGAAPAHRERMGGRRRERAPGKRRPPKGD